jgi:hypothetical protein
MKNNDNDIFDLIIGLLALSLTVPLAGIGIYATILSFL